MTLHYNKVFFSSFYFKKYMTCLRLQKIATGHMGKSMIPASTTSKFAHMTILHSYYYERTKIVIHFLHFYLSNYYLIDKKIVVFFCLPVLYFILKKIVIGGRKAHSMNNL